MQTSSNQNYNTSLQKKKCQTSKKWSQGSSGSILKFSIPFFLLNPNIVSTLLSSITIPPPNYLYFQNSLPHPQNNFLPTLLLLDNLSSSSFCFCCTSGHTLPLFLRSHNWHSQLSFPFYSYFFALAKSRYLFLTFPHSLPVTMLM
jgi:hypothetical protein